MSDHPSFTTPEEVIEYVRRNGQQSQSTAIADRDANPSKTTLYEHTGARTATDENGGVGKGTAQYVTRKVNELGQLSSSERDISGESVKRSIGATERSSSIYEHVRADGAGRPEYDTTVKTGFLGRFKQNVQSARKIVDSTPAKKTTKVNIKLFTDTEVAKTRPILVECIKWTSQHADEFIIATTKGHDKSIIIWGDIDDEIAEILADELLQRAKYNPGTAHAIRKTVDLYSRIKILGIIAPRMYRTLLIYMERGFSIK